MEVGMLKQLSLEKLAEAEKVNCSFSLFTTKKLVTNLELCRTFPNPELIRSRRLRGGDKQYNFSVYEVSNKKLLNHGAAINELVEDLHSDKYKKVIGDKLGINLNSSNPKVGFYVYDRCGDWVSPHKDKSVKLATHVLYFNESWEQEWGGQFLALNSSEITDCFLELCPLIGTSVFFTPSDSSWHAVRPILRDGVRRLSIQVEFFERGNR